MTAHIDESRRPAADHDVTAYDYDLHDDLIAQEPREPRDASRLLVLRRGDGAITHATFSDLTSFLDPGDCLVLNESRVFRARLFGAADTGRRVEVLLVEPRDDGPLLASRTWEAMLGPARGADAGFRIRFPGGWEAVVEQVLAGGLRRIRLEGPGEVAALVEEQGHVPLPPYIRRPDSPGDAARYQTVYARATGSVAAPTAGLHFTESLLEQLEGAGVRIARLVLHVGPGTFRPVREADIRSHTLHEESYDIPAETVRLLEGTRREGGRIVCTGTTSVRSLEAAAAATGGLPGPGAGRTDLFIHPPFDFRATDALVTNFHLPRSTLLMLVCAFGGREAVLRAYAEAVRERYRFYSYGDAMLVL